MNTHILQLTEHVVALILRQVKIALNFVHFVVNVVVEFLVELELNSLLQIVLEVLLLIIVIVELETVLLC